MPYQEKIEGQPCEANCGGKYVKNPKTGKVFCENKCWLNGGQPAEGNVPFKTSGENVQDKNDTIAWLNAKRCAAVLMAGEPEFNPIKYKSLVKEIYDVNKE